MDIYLVRHTTPDIEKGLCYGRSDLDVISSFKEEAKVVKSKLPLENIKVYASPLKRCQKLAQFIYGDQFTTEEKLIELTFGTWELMPWDEIPKEEIDPWYKDYVNEKAPCGESFKELEQRVLGFVKEISSKEETCVLVTHGGPIRAILAYIEGIDLKDSFNIKLDYGHVVKISL